MFGFCSDLSEGKDTLSFTLSLAVYRHGYHGTGEGGIRTLVSLLSYGALAKRRFTYRTARHCYFVAIILPQDAVSVRPVSQT